MRPTPAVGLLCVVAVASTPGCQDDVNVVTPNVVAPTLVATCEARPASGNAPLLVTFLVGVSGAQGAFAVSITYGDGSSGTDPDVPHTYTAAGSYPASFTVTTATQSARCSTAVTVTNPPPSPANRPPHVDFRTNPDATGSHADKITGSAPLDVRFNVCNSSDPEGDPLYFRMDLNGDRFFESGGTTGPHCRRDRTYPAGTWRPRVCVHDQDASGQPLHDDQCRFYTVTATP